MLTRATVFERSVGEQDSFSTEVHVTDWFLAARWAVFTITEEKREVRVTPRLA